MSKKLDDFMVIVNVNGWHIRGMRACSKGQVFEGKDIHPRMLQALKDKETFKQDGTLLRPVCDLKGGTVEELEKAMAAPEKEAPKPKVEPKPEPKVEKPAATSAEAPEPKIKKTPRKEPQD